MHSLLGRVYTKTWAQDVFQFDLEMNNNIYCMHDIIGDHSGPLAIKKKFQKKAAHFHIGQGFSNQLFLYNFSLL